MTKRVIVSTGPDALQREGLHENPETWEDGLRIEPWPGSFEWWYFDAHFMDGSSIRVNFFTKPLLENQARLKPGISITIRRPDGQSLNEVVMVEPEEFSASKEHCYLRIGESFARGDLCNYEIQVRAGDLSAQLNYQGLIPAWRTGKNYYDASFSHYDAWLAAVPYATVEGRLTYDGKMRPVKGTGYHDHRWGNITLHEHVTQWYWGHAHAGDYTLLFSEMSASKRYDGQKITAFSLFQGSRVTADGSDFLQLEEQDFIADPGGRSYPDGLDLSWQSGNRQALAQLRSPVLIESSSLVDLLPSWQRVVGQFLKNPYSFTFDSTLDLQMEFVTAQPHLMGRAVYQLMLFQ